MEDSQFAQREKKRKNTDCPSADMEGCLSTSAETFKHYEPFPAQHHKRYHVFLSFRGTDVRKTLVDHLYQSLCTGGFHVFLDTERLERGKNIGDSLKEAIRNSTVHIPIFSADYASSPWCLKELWKCKSKSTGTIIIPLFYKLKPSDVRVDKEGPYSQAFQEHIKKGRHSEKKMHAWKEALHQISLLSGWSLEESAGGYEGKLVNLVVKHLLKTLNITSLHVAKYPQGLSNRREEVAKLLKMDDHSGHVLTVGIWGKRGLGKTTLAKDIYNNIHHKFDASCFVSDVRAAAKESGKGLRNLQEQILRDLAVNGLKLNSVDDGKIQMENRLRSKKVLVILDGVDDVEQLDALVGDASSGYWFGPGSRVIVTTRDSQVLKRHNVILYDMRGLERGRYEIILLGHAFLRAVPDEGYEGITEEIVNACEGLPLSLEAEGTRLYGEKSLEIWREALKKLEKNHGKDYM